MKFHTATLAAVSAAVAIGAAALPSGAAAWDNRCPPGSHDKQYCEPPPHHHHHHHRPPWWGWGGWGDYGSFAFDIERQGSAGGK